MSKASRLDLLTFPSLPYGEYYSLGIVQLFVDADECALMVSSPISDFSVRWYMDLNSLFDLVRLLVAPDASNIVVQEVRVPGKKWLSQKVWEDLGNVGEQQLSCTYIALAEEEEKFIPVAEELVRQQLAESPFTFMHHDPIDPKRPKD